MKTNPVIEGILGRRSVRAFKERAIPREDLEAIVACGQWAPSARNRQEWTFVVVDSRARIARLSEAMRRALGRDVYDMYAPQSIVIVAHAKDAEFGREDDGCALENMFLAAHSLGIGSVWINQLQGICDEPGVRAELDALIGDPKVRHLVLDLTGVSFMDSSAIGLVIGRYKALSRRGGRVSVAGATPRVDRIFEMAGLYTIVEKLA